MSDWMQTSTGKQFVFDNPTFDIEDIAKSLAKSCRYNGHTKDLLFYSVAEHCVLIADWLFDKSHYDDSLNYEASNERAYNGLMHDWVEGYISDMVRPLKKRMPDFCAYEDELFSKGAAQFRLLDPIPDYVKLCDNRILVDERAQAMTATKHDWGLSGLRPLGVTLQFWTPKVAYGHFMDAFHMYG